MQTLLWIGDAVILLAVIPIAVTLLLRIIAALIRAHRAIVNIGQSAHAITQSLPSAVTEVSTLANAVAQHRPERSRSHTPATR